MMRIFTGLLVSFLATAVMGQSLTAVAKKEKERRKSNEQKGVPVRTITENDIVPKAEASSSSDAKPNEGEESQTDVFELILDPANKPPARGPAVPPPLGPAPDFDLRDRTGKSVSLKRLRGKPVLLDFWATWCAPCRATMPEVEKLHRKYRVRGLEVIGINIEGKSKDVLAYLDENRYSFTVLFDSGNWDSVVAKSYSVTSIPRTVLIDKDGNIVYTGFPNRLSESLIEATLNQTSGS